MVNPKIKEIIEKNNNSKSHTRMEPVKLNLIIFMGSSFMLFAAFVSAYIVAKPDGIKADNWTEFDLPRNFLFSTIAVVISSITIFLAYKAAKQDEIKRNQMLIWATLFLGLAFTVFQYLGWKEMIAQKLYFVNENSGDISASYVYVITFFHWLHLFGGLVALFILGLKSRALQVHKKNMKFMSVLHTYWHFVGLLWIYLYLFLYFA